MRISERNVDKADAVMPVRRRLINAVFFFRAESRDLLTGNISIEGGYEVRTGRDNMSRCAGGSGTSLVCPSLLVQIPQLPCGQLVS